MKQWFCTLIMALVFNAAANETWLIDYLKANQPEGRGPGFVIDKKVGVLHGEVDTTVVLYGYQVGPDMDRNHWQYLVVFEREFKEGSIVYNPSRWILVGGGRQHFQKITIKDKTITVTGLKHMPGDAMCCPSAKAKVEFKLVNRGLVAQGTSDWGKSPVFKDKTGS